MVASLQQIDTTAQDVEAVPNTDIKEIVLELTATIERSATEPELVQDALNIYDDLPHPDTSGYKLMRH